MPGLRWDDVHEFLSSDGAGYLPDVEIPDTTIEDWAALLDLIPRTGWAFEYRLGGDPAPWPTAAALFDDSDDLDRDLRVRPVPDILAIFRPYGPAGISFDLSGREIIDQARLDVVCEFFATMGRHLGKAVVLTPEFDPNRPVFGYAPELDQVVRFPVHERTVDRP